MKEAAEDLKQGIQVGGEYISFSDDKAIEQIKGLQLLMTIECKEYGMKINIKKLTKFGKKKGHRKAKIEIATG